MALIVSGIRISLNDNTETAIEQAIKKLKIKNSDVLEASIAKTSIDARHRNAITIVCSVKLSLSNKNKEQKLAEQLNFVTLKNETELNVKFGTTPIQNKPVIAGFGPAGMFAGLVLAKYGYQPIVIERGEDVDTRVQAVNAFWEKGMLNPQSNVQFGEGGAGTFSDGKLTTRINDERCDYVLKEFVNHNAPKDILNKSKPHIGTDYLRQVVKSIREEIISLGGEVHFNTMLTGLTIKNGVLQGIRTNKGEIETSNLILSIGHSARDTFEMLLQNGMMIEPKAFSVGARIEQKQDIIDKGLYGDLAGHPVLPKGEYQLSLKNGNRAVYTFCMCPGGLVVPSSSEPNTVVTNGMSEYARDRENANSAIVVSVDSADFGSEPLSGMYFQRKLEQQAYEAGNKTYKAPAQSVNSFLNHQSGIGSATVTPSYSLGVYDYDFHNLFPQSICSMLEQGLRTFNAKLKGFSDKDAVLTGVETRTSSPVRITRNDELESITVKGVYPCGEGAGYAGGIMSAAVDGIRVAQAIIEKYKP